MSADAVIRTRVLSLLILSLAGSQPSFSAQEQATNDGKTFYVATNGNDRSLWCLNRATQAQNRVPESTKPTARKPR